MRIRTVLRHPALGCLVTIVAVVIVIVGLVRLVERLGDPPRTQQEAEDHLDRSILFYTVWDGIPYIVVEMRGRVYFDRLILDWISTQWPPTPRWQWTGDWSYIDATSDPASVGVHGRPEGAVVFVQINSTDIVTLEMNVDGEWRGYPVSFPAYAVRLGEDQRVPTQIRWLDAGGRVIWSVERGNARPVAQWLPPSSPNPFSHASE